ncbi:MULTISPECIES: phosphate acetyltransferase [unclassified Campylobacter]|uniref:phosphate acetyltransferase n=1 Tax=unclassified Campylobacter TaxID=2593542 RepID=UPI001475572E|nr:MULTISPECIES: phosphate acetyltransferase [unclassified Campylobacter]
MKSKGIYLITANFSKIYEIISAKFKNVTVFEPIGGFVCTKEAAVAFENGHEKELIKSIIKEFNRLQKKYDLVVVRAFEAFSNLGKFELNLLLARHLNTPVFSEKNLKALNINSNLVISSNLDEVLDAQQSIITPFRFENLLIETASKDKKMVVLPESNDERILKASELLMQTGAVNLTLLGDETAVKSRADELGINLSGVKFINLEKNVFQESFAKELYELRKHKGMSLEKAKELILDKTYFGTMMVQTGLADAMVSGASTNTADTVRPAFQIIKTTPDSPLVSSSFVMCMGEEILIYADCAVIPNPDANALAHIAISSAKTAVEFGIEPRVALLSYATGNSSEGSDTDLVKEAKKIINELEPELKVEGPIQYDAAIDIGVARKKIPNSEVAGRANVFVFPNLNSGNIGYKIAQRSGHCIAIGPILQGLKKPVNDLSRGCLVDDIINTVLITAIQAGEKK